MKRISLLLPFIFLTASCSKRFPTKDHMIDVMVEKGDGFDVLSPSIRIHSGEDALFQLRLNNSSLISSVSYSKNSISYQDNLATLTLFDVKYPLTVKVTTSETYIHVHTDAKEGSDFFPYPIYREHLRINTPIQTGLYKQGYQLFGFKEDLLSTSSIPLGSRFSKKTEHLYPDFRKETDTNNLIYREKEDGSLSLLSCLSEEPEIILPASIDGKKVTEILEGCFRNKRIKTLHIPKSITSIAKGSFIDCSIDTLSLYDNMKRISDDCFLDSKVNSLRINTDQLPAYMNTYFALFPDKVDLLIKSRGKKKLVLFSGSTTRYGYDSTYFRKAYPDYEPINMGVFAYTNQSAQLEIIEHFIEDGDVLLVSPEFDSNAFDYQMFKDHTLDSRFFRMVEGDYALFSYLPLEEYDHVFDSFLKHCQDKALAQKQEFSLSPLYFDDDGNHHSEKLYNQYLDFSMERIGEVKEGRIYQPEIDFTTKRFTDAYLDSYNNFYQNYTEKDIRIYFTYSPRNKDSLTEESTPENRKRLEELLKRKIELPIISSFEDCLYPAYDFYLIDDHLTSEASIIRTKKVIEDLRPYLS